MIKVENIDVWGFEHAIRGMRNPMNSWDKSDSGVGCSSADGNTSFCLHCTENSECVAGFHNYCVGEADLGLMQRLFRASKDGNNAHRKYLRQIFVSMDITAPLYWWKEFDTYKVGTVSNSCSTMHKIHANKFTPDDFSIEHLDAIPRIRMLDLIDTLNNCRETYLKSKDKHDWWQMIQLLPSSYNQRRTLTFDYENVYAMIQQREGHKLDEWREFVKVLRDLPYVKEIAGWATSKSKETCSESEETRTESKEVLMYVGTFEYDHSEGITNIKKVPVSKSDIEPDVISITSIKAEFDTEVPGIAGQCSVRYDGEAGKILVIYPVGFPLSLRNTIAREFELDKDCTVFLSGLRYATSPFIEHFGGKFD